MDSLKRRRFMNVLNTKNNQSSLQINFYKQKYLDNIDTYTMPANFNNTEEIKSIIYIMYNSAKEYPIRNIKFLPFVKNVLQNICSIEVINRNLPDLLLDNRNIKNNRLNKKYTFHRRNLYISNVYKLSSGNILKSYKYLYCNELYDKCLTTADIINELTFQLYAKSIEQECGIYVPEIQKYCLYETSNTYYKYIFIIIMEHVDCINLGEYLKSKTFSKLELQEIKTELEIIIQCMRNKELFHNDLHLNNILVNTTNNPKYISKYIIIDFGEARIPLQNNINKTNKCITHLASLINSNI